MTTTLCRTIDLALRDARGRFEPVNENTAAFIESQILAAGLLVVDAPTAVAALDGTSNSERFQLDGVKPNGAKSGHDFVSGAPTEEQIEAEAMARFPELNPAYASMTYPAEAIRTYNRSAFVSGARWAASPSAAGVAPQEPESGRCGGCRDLGPHRNVPGCDYYEPDPAPEREKLIGCSVDESSPWAEIEAAKQVLSAAYGPGEWAAALAASPVVDWEYATAYQLDGSPRTYYSPQPSLEAAQRALRNTIAQRMRDAAAGLPDHTADPLPKIVRRSRTGEWEEVA